MVTLYSFLLQYVLAALIGMHFPEKLLLSAMLLVPLGFLMGMPFPAGLREIAGHDGASSTESAATHDSTIEWAWAMNAASSVLGSVLAIVIAIQFGLNFTLVCGAAAYFLALLLRGKLRLTESAG